MNGLLGKFSLENSEEFFNNYKVNNTLAQEASTALDQFILSLNEFFDLCEDLSEEMLMENTEVSWYSYANVESSGDYTVLEQRVCIIMNRRLAMCQLT